MSTYQTNHPNYPRAKLALVVDEYPIGTECGVASKFTNDLVYVPNDITSVSTSASNDVRPYKSLYGVEDNDRYDDETSIPALKSSNILPYNNVLKMYVASIPLFSELTSTSQFVISIKLFEHGGVEYYAGFSAIFQSQYKRVTCSLNIYSYSNGTYTVSKSCFSVVSKINNDFTATTATTYLNSILQTIRYFFITPFRYAGNATNLIITSSTSQMCFGLYINGNYQWSTPNTFNFDLFTIDPNDIIEDHGYTPTPEPPGPSDDPYSPGGYSAGGGGYNPDGTGTTGTGGLHDDSSDAIPTPSLPGNIATGSGLFTAYNPDASQLASFAGALWNMQPADINDVLRFLFGGDAFNAIIGLHLLPVAPTTGGSPNIKLGNWDTGVSAPKIISQYVQVPFGSVLLSEYWGNCIDYAPYTKIQLALPYIGIVDVDTDDVLGSTNTLTYNIDVLSGAICATLKCEKFNLNSVIYQWSGACAVSLPFSGASYNSVLGAIAGIAAAGMGFASMAAGPIGAALPAAALAAGGGAFGAGSAASIMGTMKGKVQKSGSFGANSGALGIMTPYFILTRPVQSVPETWQADKGYPSNISAQLGTLSGYTEVSEINLECSGTEAEKEEIISLLKSGVIF